MKAILLVVAVLTLAGCQSPVNEWTNTAPVDLKTIKGLEDCIYSRINVGNKYLHVVRCPDSTVSTTQDGKNPVHTITINGTEYVKKQ